MIQTAMQIVMGCHLADTVPRSSLLQVEAVGILMIRAIDCRPLSYPLLPNDALPGVSSCLKPNGSHGHQ